MHKGQVVYEWDQTLDDVNIYINPPKVLLRKYQDENKKTLKPGEKLPKLEVKIASTHVTVGIQGNPPFLNVSQATHDFVGGTWRQSKYFK